MSGKLKEDLTGKRFGRLLVIRRAENSKSGKPMWLCKCDCGNDFVAWGSSLVSGGAKSCGCYNREIATIRHTKHGGSKRSGRERLYGVWNMMKQRCSNHNHKEYARYGGRGITVCEEWESYETFRKWALANGYDENAKSHECTIDRIDNEKGYSPDNCRWVGAEVQGNNTSANKVLEFGGEKRTIAEWATETGIKRGTIAFRLKHGWSVEDALTTIPVKGRNQTWKLK